MHEFGALMGRHRTTVADWCREREVPPEASITLEMYRLLDADARSKVWKMVARNTLRYMTAPLRSLRWIYTYNCSFL